MKILEFELPLNGSIIDLSSVGYSLNRVSDFRAVVDSMTSTVSRIFKLEYPVNVFKENEENIFETSKAEIFVHGREVFILYLDSNLWTNEDDVFGGRDDLLRLVILTDHLEVAEKKSREFINKVSGAIVSYYMMISESEDVDFIKPIAEENVDISTLWKRSNVDAIRNIQLNNSSVYDGLKYKGNEFVDKDVVFALVVSDPIIRGKLINIKKNKIPILVDDDFNEKLRMSIFEATQQKGYTYNCKVSDLLQSKFQVRCTKKNSPLLDLHWEYKSSNTNLENFRCPHCGRKFSEELISEVYETTPYLDSLLDSSNWMTIFVVETLIRKGVDAEKIYYNTEYKSEEIDIICNIEGIFVMFELKDKDFDLGQAYSIPYRESIFCAEKSIIISTGKVSKEVKEHFSRINTEKSQEKEIDEIDHFIPTYIEGLEFIESKIERVILKCKKRKLNEVLRELNGVSALNFHDIIYSYYKLEEGEVDNFSDSILSTGSSDDLPF